MTGNAHDDFYGLLRSANPVREEELPQPSESVAAQHLYQQITGTPYVGRLFRGRRRGVPAVAAALLVAAGGVSAGVAVASSNHTPVHSLSVSCFAGDSLGAEQVVVAAVPGGPVVACAEAWAEGHVGSGPVPLLVACLTEQGVAAVFPSSAGADVCGQLGLPALPAGVSSLPTQSTTTVPVEPLPGSMPVAIEQAIITDLRASCVSSQAATTLIQNLVGKVHLPWSVVIPRPFPPGRPCASPGFDEIDHEVVLTGVPPVGASSSTG